MDIKEIGWERAVNSVTQDRDNWRTLVYSVMHVRAVKSWHGGVVEDSILLRGPFRPFKINVLCSFETSGIDYPVTRCHAPGKLSPRGNEPWDSVKCGKCEAWLKDL
jgi:hypothetical protein